METFKAHPQLGRFTLRDEGDFKLAPYPSFYQALLWYNQPHHLSLTGTTIAIGKILKVVE